MKNHANIAAAHSTPATFAVDRFRRRKSRSGMSGTRVRDSIPRNAAKIRADAPKTPSVRADVQPFWLPFTIA
jgi:hypothetical protein